MYDHSEMREHRTRKQGWSSPVAQPRQWWNQPNQGLELKGNSVRSCVAPAIPGSSSPALMRQG
jgi:hypothetical protein